MSVECSVRSVVVCSLVSLTLASSGLVWGHGSSPAIESGGKRQGQGGEVVARAARAPVDFRAYRMRLRALNATVSDAQRMHLARFLEEWRLDQADPGEVMARLHADLQAVLSPAQLRELQALSSPGVDVEAYSPQGCLLSTNVGVVVSVVTSLVCPSEVSSTATVEAFVAASYAAVCGVEGRDTCDGAALYTSASAQLWQSVLAGGCTVAAAPTGVMAGAYVLCGGL